MEAGVQDRVGHAFLIEEFGQHFGLFDRHRADQDRLAAFGMFLDRPGDAAEFILDILVETVLLVDPLHRLVGRDGNDVHLVDFVKFGRFGRSGAGHARNLGIHAEIILEGDGRERLVFRLDLDAFLGLHRLMQAIRPAATIHHAAGELVDDDDLAVLDDIVDVAAEHDVGAQRLVHMMHHLGIFEIIEVGALEEPGILQQTLDPLGAVFGQGDGALLFVLLIIGFGDLLHDRIDRDIEFGLVVGRAGDDERRARLVDQDRIHLIDDRIVERALDHRGAVIFHIVAQIVEAEFVVGRIGDVGGIGGAALILADVGHDDAGGQPQEAIDLPHPVAVAAGEIVVDGDDMDALALQRVEVGGERRHQRLALTRAHFGDLAAMQHDAAHHLHVEMPHAQHPDGGFAHRGEGFGQQIVQRLARRQPLAELDGLRGQIRIVQRLHRGFERGDPIDDLAQRLHIAFVGRTEDGLGECAEHGHS